jgi:hypothetical protein
VNVDECVAHTQHTPGGLCLPHTTHLDDKICTFV